MIPKVLPMCCRQGPLTRRIFSQLQGGPEGGSISLPALASRLDNLDNREQL